MMNATCREFATRLAAKESVPGGGGAAAYVGALGVALCSMVGNFTTGKKAYADVEADVLPKDDPTRAEVLEAATKAACMAPMEMMRQICRSIDLLEEMGQKGSRMLVSDVGCGVLLARAALEAASMNVFVNTTTLADRSFALQFEAECDAMLASYGPKAEEIAADVMGRIRG